MDLDIGLRHTFYSVWQFDLEKDLRRQSDSYPKIGARMFTDFGHSLDINPNAGPSRSGFGIFAELENTWEEL